MIDSSVKKAMLDGVWRGVEQATANCFNVYRQQRPDRSSKSAPPTA